MRATKTRFSTIGGALLAIGVLLAVAIHLNEQIRGVSSSQPVIASGLAQHTAMAPGIEASATILDRTDTTEQGRLHVLVHALLPSPVTASAAEQQLGRLAESLYRDDPKSCAITILAFSSESQRESSGDDAPWSLVWSPDGRGWDGLSQNDFQKHFYTRSEQ
jgi:hypothetical protein